MSAREWKPGDVAATEFRGVESRAFVVEGRACPDAHPRIAHWHAKGGGWNPLNDREVTYRPLVVIDPDNAEQVARLRTLYDTQCHIYGDARPSRDLDPLADALREFANPTPPRPAEPQGLGAVVEDTEGVRWIRTDLPGESEFNKPWQSGPIHAHWQGVRAVKVLSEGVTS